MIVKVYTKPEMMQILNELENGCDVNLYLVKNGYYARVVMCCDEYFVGISKGEFEKPFILKEELTLKETKELFKGEELW